MFARLCLLGVTALALGCRRAPLAVLDPAGEDARLIAALFWWMAAGTALVWLACVGVLVHCLRPPRTPRPARQSPAAARRLIVGGGVVVPTLLLVVLVAAAVPPIDALVDGPPAPGQLRVHVTGQQWWWRVRYEGAGGAAVELANALYVPRGRVTHLTLTSADVIHSFWVPTLAGKIDMVPGRTTSLTLEPTAAGTFHGVCAEYCGTAHARMAFAVVVLEPDEFGSWLAAEAAPAAVPNSDAGRDGAALFTAVGCGGCHAVRGTPAEGRIGPDLTHVAARPGLAASGLPDAEAALAAWIAAPDAAKPGAAMPPFAALGDAPLRSLAAYLRELR